jgi:hypothetical protein
MGNLRRKKLDQGDYELIYFAFLHENMQLEIDPTGVRVVMVSGKWHRNRQEETTLGTENYDWLLAKYGIFKPRNT